MDEKWIQLEQYIRDIMQAENIAGAAVAVSQHGQVIYAKGLGVGNIDERQPVTPHTIFGVASVTKSFTALAIMKLAEEGKLSVNDAVIKHLPEFSLSGVQDVGAIKIHHLLSHTTGIPPRRRRQELSTFAEHLEYLATEPVEMLGRPGQYVSYCNDAFLLLGAIIEKYSGERYVDYVTNTIIRPLSMDRSTFDVNALESFADVSTPYVYNRKEQQLEAQPWPRLGNYEVGGGVRSSVMDLLKYGSAYVGHTEIVGRGGLQQMYTPVAPVGRNSYYGYALKITPQHAGITLVEHGGGQPGVSANFGFVPEKGLVVAVLTNVTGVSAARIWLAAVNAALNLPLEYSSATEHPQEHAQEQESFVGIYASDEGAKLTIYLDEGNLNAETEGQSFPLHHSGDNYFFYNYRGQKVIKFHVSPDGEPWAAFMGLRMLRKVVTSQ